MKKHYYFIGIGGIGMGSIASLLIDKKIGVTGSDLKENKMIDFLRSKGVRVFIGHKASQIEGADAIVYSSAITDNNPELQEAKKKGIDIFKRAEILAQLMAQKKGIAIAGSHGKTTTSSMIAHVFKMAGLQPTIAIGGIVNNGLYSADLGQGEYFVAEVDESDGSFLSFNPHYSIITNIDFEHVDFYQSWDNILKSYKQFMNQTKDEGCLIVCGDDVNIRDAMVQIHKKHVAYGFHESNDVVIRSVSCKGFGSLFECVYRGKTLGEVCLCVPGKHNVLNASAVAALSIAMDLDFSIVQKALATYRGVQRRFTIHYQARGIVIVEDYGHHPTEIAATIETARLFEPKRLIVVFQPHRYSRTKFLMNEFAESLQACDYLVMTDIYAACEQPIQGIEAQGILEEIRQKRHLPSIYLTMDKVVGHLLDIVNPGDFIIVLGAGNINQILKDLTQRIEERFLLYE